MAAVDGSDRVDPQGSAGWSGPPELEGKTPAEIQAWYADRENTILDNARRMVEEAHQQGGVPPRTEEPRKPPTPPSNEPLTRAEFYQATGAARENLIQMAIMMARTDKADWDRLLPDIRKIMDSCPADQQMNSKVWEEAYFNVRGHMTQTLIDEARNRALGLEQVSPPPPPPPKPRQLNEAELAVCTGCNITPESYIKAEERLNTGYQPFTVDNRRRIGA